MQRLSSEPCGEVGLPSDLNTSLFTDLALSLFQCVFSFRFLSWTFLLTNAHSSPSVAIWCLASTFITMEPPEALLFD